MPSITTWVRLEPRCRDAEMTAGLEARVFDAAWFLARQWQMGELDAEDAASPVSATMELETAELGDWTLNGAAVAGAGAGVPLDVLVERDARDAAGRAPRAQLDIHRRAQAGRQLLRRLSAAGLERFHVLFLERYPMPAAAVGLDDETAAQLALHRGRTPDGAAAYRDIARLLPAAGALLPADYGAGAAVEAVSAELFAYRIWYEALHREPRGGPTGWDPGALEHRVGATAGMRDATLRLAAPDYLGDGLDWFSFDVSADPTPGAPRFEVLDAHPIPRPVRYPGMPASRFWELEDAAVDLGAVDAAAGDAARLVFLEFALVHGGDWFLVPLRLAAGAVHRLHALVVRDTFGIDSRVRSYRELDRPDEPFRLFGDGRLLVLPTTAARAESEAVEEVALGPDDAASLSWAIEIAVENGAGRRRETADLDGPRAAPAGPPLGVLAYRLSTPLPPHWFPLLPAGGDLVTVAVAPTDAGAPRGEIVASATAIPERELAREGVRVLRRYRLARGADGETHLWVAHEKGPGVAILRSGRRHDILE